MIKAGLSKEKCLYYNAKNALFKQICLQCFSRATVPNLPVWYKYFFFGRMNIWIYLLPSIMDERISEYIGHDKNITNEYLN